MAPLVTWIVTVQPATGRLGTVRLSAVVPMTRAGLLVTPAHVPPIVALDTVMPVSVSVKFALVSADAFGLLSVNVIVELPLTGIVVGVNDLLIVGGTTAVRFAVLDDGPPG